MSPEVMANKHAALDQVKTVRRQLDELTRMLESDAYCVEVMKQIHTVRCTLERASRSTLHKHLETCFSEAVFYGRKQAAIDELVDAVNFTPAATGPLTEVNGSANGHSAATNINALLASTTLSLPGIASQMCKAALEGIVTPIAGVRAVQVDVLTKTITIHHDHRASSRRLIEAIEEQGYHVAAPSVTNPQTSNHDSRWERCGAHAEDRGPVTITSASHALPEEHCVRLGFVDGDGI